jgi:hypothetical protein
MNAKQIVNRMLEAEPPPDDKEVEHYLKQVKPKPHRLSPGFIRYVLGTPEGRKKMLQLRGTPEPGPHSEPHQIVGEAEELPDDKEVQRYLELVKAKPQLRRYSREELRRYLATRPPAQPEPPSEPHQIVGEALEDQPQDMRAEVDRLLPTKTYHLKGNSMIHAPGVIRMAQNEWRNGRQKQKKWAMGVIHAWEGLPEEVYLALLNNKVDIETQGDDAVVTVKQY